MHPNAALVSDFYERFKARDGAGMAAHYATDVVFSDPVFPRLEGERAGAMWKMLTERGKDLRVSYEILSADDSRVKVHWVANYTFSKTGRQVENRITGELEIRDGKIVRHTDTFDFWRWSRRALGTAGMLLGWSGFLRSKIQQQAAKGLDQFMSR